MGVMLSVLFSYMGAIEFVFIVRDLTHHFALHQMRLQNGERKQSDLSVLQDKIRASIDALESVDLESVERMQDGVLYNNGYRIDSEQCVSDVAQQWDERRKVLCVAEVSTVGSSSPKPIISNGIQNERTTNQSEIEPDDLEPKSSRSIVRDDRLERRKAFKKRNSSSSSDSIRLSREEELKMFTSLEEEENRNTSFTPITYSNYSSKNVDASFHEKQKYEAEAWGNKKPSNYHDSALWKRERATSIVEEQEGTFTNGTMHLLRTG